jgi:cytidyltransferase-like protein
MESTTEPSSRLQHSSRGATGTGVAVGVFDLLHHGHISFLRVARHACGHLIVGLHLHPASSKDVRVHHSYGQRQRRLALLQAVDRIVPYTAVDELVQELRFDRLFLSEDQRHPGFSRALAHCCSRGIAVIRLPRTPGISSTALRQGLPGRFMAAAPPG